MSTKSLTGGNVNSYLKHFLSTDARSNALLYQRVMLGAVMFPHGAQKLLGWFGGYGMSATIEYFVSYYHVPAPIAFLVVLGESVGALMLVLGLGTRFAALGISLIMAGAALSHLSVGFFMNWFGNQSGEGFEYHLLALGLVLVVMFKGAGRYSLDAALASAVERGLVTSKSAEAA
ncbi:MAG: DoxX family protein [Polyangiaceae bacterium]